MDGNGYMRSEMNEQEEVEGSAVVPTCYRESDMQVTVEQGPVVNVQSDLTYTSALLPALRKRQYEVAKWLVEGGAEVNVQDNDGGGYGYFALMCVTEDRHCGCDVVKLLIEKGAKVNMQTNYGRSALMAASGNGQCEVVELLIQKGAEVNMQDSDGRSALIQASQCGYCNVVKLLTEKDAKVNVQTKMGQSALMLASQYGYCDVVKLLLEKGAKVNMPDNAGESALTIAIEKGNSDVVKLLIEKLTAQTGSGLPSAVEQGSVVPVNVQSLLTSALLLAMRKRHYEVFKLLVGGGADVNVQDNDRYGYFPLMYATEDRYCDVIKQLIKKGAEVNMQNNGGRSALMVASVNGHCEAVEQLIEKGAEVNMQDNSGRSALTEASTYRRCDVVKLLLEKGAKVNVQTKIGQSALMLASQYGNCDVVKLLLEKGAEVNMPDNAVKAALIVAIEKGHSDVIKLLMEKLTSQAGSGLSAVTTEHEEGHQDVVQRVVNSEGLSASESDKKAELIEEHSVGTSAHCSGGTAIELVSQEREDDVVKATSKGPVPSPLSVRGDSPSSESGHPSLKREASSSLTDLMPSPKQLKGMWYCIGGNF